MLNIFKYVQVSLGDLMECSLVKDACLACMRPIGLIPNKHEMIRNSLFQIFLNDLKETFINGRFIFNAYIHYKYFESTLI